MKITKMQGAGNDFIMIDNFAGEIPEENFGEMAKDLCRRRLSVGADGMIIAQKPELEGDIRMVFYNADGSQGEMCGNGARCLARFTFELGLAPEKMVLETLAGLVPTERLDKELYKVRLPRPTMMEKITLPLGDLHIEAEYVELGDPGVPHLCIEKPNFDTIPQEQLLQMSRKLRHHSQLEKGANVNYYRRIEEAYYLEKTFERGVEDFTMACGTGSGSVAVVLQKADPSLRKKRIQFSVPGGELFVEAEWSGETVLSLDLIGPATKVYEAEVLAY